VKVQRALISVFNKSGVESFAKGLTDLGVTVISTGGTAKRSWRLSMFCVII